MTTLQQTTLEALAERNLDAFWKHKSRYINQMLHRLMGKVKLNPLNGEIVGVAEVNGRQRRKSLLPPASGDLVAFGHSRHVNAHQQNARQVQ